MLTYIGKLTVKNGDGNYVNLVMSNLNIEMIRVEGSLRMAVLLSDDNDHKMKIS